MPFEEEGSDDSGPGANINRGRSSTFVFLVNESFVPKFGLRGFLNFWINFLSVGYIDDDIAFEFESDNAAQTDDPS